MRVKCPAQEHNTMSPARAQTRVARPGDERTNHEATAPPTRFVSSKNELIVQVMFPFELLGLFKTA